MINIRYDAVALTLIAHSFLVILRRSFVSFDTLKVFAEKLKRRTPA
jgi:hypothetical protein